ncbi:MAG: TetR/AcrR family transcriptional regulator [Bacillota bacterium]
MDQPEGKFERILEAAAEVFAEKGFHQATIDQIAQTAGIGKGTVYLYFKSKERLLQALLLEGFGRIMKHASRATAAILDPKRRLLKLMEQHLHFMQQPIPLFKLAVAEAFRGELQSQARKYQELYARTLADGVAAGLFRPHDPEVVSGAIMGALSLAGMLLAKGHLNRPSEAVLAEISQLVLAGIEGSGVS